MKVLIATDGSEFGDMALQTALARSWPEGSQMRVIGVVEKPAIAYVTSGDSASALDEINREVRAYFTRMVREAVERLRLAGWAATSVIKEGSAAECIIDEAREWDADLIMLGTHGRKGLSRFFLGSVALRVITHAGCSVEIVKIKDQAK